MKYKITIVSIETVEKQGREWKQVDLVPVTKEEASKSWDSERMPPFKEKFDYVYYNFTDHVESKILEQTVDAIDLPSVIKAINNL